MSRKDVNEIIDNLKLFPISKGYRIGDFNSCFEEYTNFLKENALDSQEKNISKTHLLVNVKNGDIVAYITLLTGSIKLNQDEVIKHEIPMFASYPSLKIAKIAVDDNYNKEYKGLGTLLVELSIGFKKEINDLGVACRFLEVDADVENNENVIYFYEKCGFVCNQKYSSKKRTKTISMRLDDTI